MTLGFDYVSMLAISRTRALSHLTRPCRRRRCLVQRSTPDWLSPRCLSQDLSATTPQTSSYRAHCAPYPRRTHTCGALSEQDAGSKVILTGWLLPGRKGKLLSFFPLKDSHGITQLIVNHSQDTGADVSALTEVPVESTVLIEGTVLLRPPEARRPGPTGEIDVQVDKYTVLNPAGDLPFIPSNPHNLANDDLRARYRYLDLRRTALSDNLKKRSRVAHIVRDILHEQDFVEVETPVLLRSSPEGAREFLVPTRTSKANLNGGEITAEPLFYALQQSPQQPKQLLICSGGVDRYFQIAKCFRDEDGRKDRQPEFTQVDVEMAFVSWGPGGGYISRPEWTIGGGEIRDVVECLIRKIWLGVEGVNLSEHFKIMTYNEAMNRFGSDKPDTRFGLEIIDITEHLPEDLRSALDKDGEIIECIPVRKGIEPEFLAASKACEQFPSVIKWRITKKTQGSWLAGCGVLSNCLSFDSSAIGTELKLQQGDEVWISRRDGKPKGGSTALGNTRLRLFEIAQNRKEFTVTKEPHFLWVIEFPLFTKADGDKDFLAKGRWSSSHHPFTAPKWEDVPLMHSPETIESVRGQHYDLVLNGMEIGGGSVRIHDAGMQDHIFSNILQLTETEKAPFQHLLHALRCGAPPHGGIALGFDRLMAILCNTQSIRDVIAFPKTSTGADLLFRSPAAINNETLSQYGIQPKTVT